MKKIKKKYKRLFILFVVVLIVFLVLIIGKSFLNDDSDTGDNSNKTDSISYNDYVIEKGHFGKFEKYDPSHSVSGYKGGNDEAYYINGKITSKIDKSFILITFNLYDKDDKLLGIAVSGLNGLQKNKTYNFKALSLIESKYNKDIDHYKLKEIK